MLHLGQAQDILLVLVILEFGTSPSHASHDLFRFNNNIQAHHKKRIRHNNQIRPYYNFFDFDKYSTPFKDFQNSWQASHPLNKFGNLDDFSDMHDHFMKNFENNMKQITQKYIPHTIKETIGLSNRRNLLTPPRRPVLRKTNKNPKRRIRRRRQKRIPSRNRSQTRRINTIKNKLSDKTENVKPQYINKYKHPYKRRYKIRKYRKRQQNNRLNESNVKQNSKTNLDTNSIFDKFHNSMMNTFNDIESSMKTANTLRNPINEMTRNYFDINTVQSDSAHRFAYNVNTPSVWQTNIKNDDTNSSIPCIKCPKRKRVFAQKGKDCVPFNEPNISQVECDPRPTSNVEIKILGDVQQGYLLHEGIYNIQLMISAGVPHKSCNFQYQVKVHKCSELPAINHGAVQCTAGRAWGSECHWSCTDGYVLKGHSKTLCKGQAREPQWSSEMPQCVQKVKAGCPSPTKIRGGSIKCKNIQTSNFKPIFSHGSACTLTCQPPIISRYRTKNNLVHINSINFQHYPSYTINFSCENGIWTPQHKLDVCDGSNINYINTEKKILRPAEGECSDLEVELGPSRIVHLIPPRFYSNRGVNARVVCSIDRINKTGIYTRTCYATDPQTKTQAKCSYKVTVSDSTNYSCLKLEAPENGSLNCSYVNKREECIISCKKGFRLHPTVSSGIIKCNGLIWDFQQSKYDKIPHCTWKR